MVKKLLLSMLFVLSTTLLHAQKFEDFSMLSDGTDLIAVMHNTTDKNLLSTLYVDLIYPDGTIDKDVLVMEYPLDFCADPTVLKPNEYLQIKFLLGHKLKSLPIAYKIRKIYFLK